MKMTYGKGGKWGEVSLNFDACGNKNKKKGKRKKAKRKNERRKTDREEEEKKRKREGDFPGVPTI